MPEVVEAADLNAKLIVPGLENKLGDYLSEKGKQVTQNQNNTQQKNKEVDTTGWAARVQPKSDPNLPTLFIIGDSTVKANQGNGLFTQTDRFQAARSFSRRRITVFS